MHLILATYDDDAERKKIEYLIAKYGARRVKDVVIEVDDSVFEPFAKELFGRIPEEKIKIYTVSEKKIRVERIKEEIKETFDADIETVKQFVNYLIVRRRGNYRGRLSGFDRYRLHTKKGLTEISLRYYEEAGNTRLWLIIEGSSEGVKMMKEEMEKEFESYKESLRAERR